MKEYSTDAINESMRAGWLTHVRYIDKDPARGLLGVRLTNAAALFARALSVQIFDRSTVALSFGFTNDETVKLTEEDGAQFVAWLRDATIRDQAMKEVLDIAAGPGLAIDWDAIPEHAPELPEFVTNATDLAKASLVGYLVKNHPEQFGRYATAQAAGGEFFEEVRALIADPARDLIAAHRTITELVGLAHDAYAEANGRLRAWRQTSGQDAAINWLEARTAVRLAETLRARVRELRNLHHITQPAEHPAGEYPEAITWDDSAMRILTPSTAPAPDIKTLADWPAAAE